MSLISTAKNQIAKYGFKGAASLIRVSSSSNLASLTVTESDSAPILLESYIGSYPSSKVNDTSIFATDRRVLAVPDADWDGLIDEDDKLSIEGETYNIISFDIKRLGNTIAYVVIQARG